MSDKDWQSVKPTDFLSSDEIKSLSPRSNLWGSWLTVHAWGVIFGCAALYAALPGFWTGLLAVIVVGGRQLGLAILMHEAAHGLLFKSRKINDWVGQHLIASPVLIDMTLYRKRHMAHHRFTRSESDPENFLYTPFPVSRASMARKILRDLTGLVFLRTQIGIFRYVWGQKDGRFKGLGNYYLSPFLVNLILVLVASSVGRVDVWLVCWLLPMMTTQQLFLRIRNIAEHATIPDVKDPLRNSRTVIPNLLERATVAPYYVHYHIEHHLLPFVPCYRLKQLHSLMIEKGFGPRMEIQQGYLSVLAVNTKAA